MDLAIFDTLVSGVPPGLGDNGSGITSGQVMRGSTNVRLRFLNSNGGYKHFGVAQNRRSEVVHFFFYGMCQKHGHKKIILKYLSKTNEFSSSFSSCHNIIKDITCLKFVI